MMLPLPRHFGHGCWSWKKPCEMRTWPTPLQVSQVMGLWPLAAPLPPQVSIEVKDNGPGISADDIERIFSPFFTTKPQGTGLGLAIVRKVVDAHDGRIDAVSAPGRGATFRVTLPVMPSVRSMGR